MSSHLQRAQGCFPFSRSWRTACSRLLSSKLVLILGIVYVLHSSSNHQTQAGYSSDTNGTRYYTFSCGNQSWCGEKWAANRILRFHYNVTDVLTFNKTTHNVIIHNCNASRSSIDCTQSSEDLKNNITPIRVVTADRFPKPYRTTKMRARSLYLITTDNINNDSFHHDRYPRDQDKIWQFRIPRNCKMTVYFARFDLEESNSCINDSFTVQTSRDQRDIYRYCEDLTNITIKRIRRVQMTFHSNHEATAGGIHAVACLSNLHDPITETEFESRMPCTCSLEPEARRKKKSNERKTDELKMKIKEEKENIEEWLLDSMERGEDVLEYLAEEAPSLKERYLRERYLEVLRLHKEW